MHAPATFFYVGQQLRYWGPSLRAELKHGFAVANHTQNHSMLPRLNAAAQRRQVLTASRAAAGWGAHPPRLFRPPYGSYDANTLRLLRSLRILMVLWTTDTGDYRRPGTKAIVAAALHGARPGAIILMHDAGGIRDQTIAALPGIIRELRRRHYRLVTVPGLIVDDPPRARELLRPLSELDTMACGASAVWFIVPADLAQRVSRQAGAVRAFADPRVELWRVAGRPCP